MRKGANRANPPKGGGTIVVDLSRFDPVLGERLVRYRKVMDVSRSKMARIMFNHVCDLYDMCPDAALTHPAAFKKWLEGSEVSNHPVLCLLKTLILETKMLS